MVDAERREPLSSLAYENYNAALIACFRISSVHVEFSICKTTGKKLFPLHIARNSSSSDLDARLQSESSTSAVLGTLFRPCQTTKAPPVPELSLIHAIMHWLPACYAGRVSGVGRSPLGVLARRPGV